MAETLFQVNGGAAPTTAAQATIATGTAIKTLIQVAAAASLRSLYIVEWGVSFDAAADAAKIKCELIVCTGAATVTAYAAADVVKVTDPNGPASQIQLGTSLSGFNASVEGTVANARVVDAQHVSPAAGYLKQYPMGREIEVLVATFIRIRVTSGVTYNAYPYIQWAE